MTDKKVKKPLTRKKKTLRWVGGIAALALVAATAVGGYTVWDLNNRIQDNSVDIGEASLDPQVLEPNVTVDEFTGAFTMLLVGNDDGNGDPRYGLREKALNDVNILLHVSADHSKATAISVPRDMFVDIPECTNETTGEVVPAESGVKINQTLSRGGLKCVADTFRELTGQRIPYAAMIQFDGVIALSNAVDGVPVCVSADIVDPLSGLNLTAGEHTLQGDSALAFLRTRHGVGDGSDLGRISNQQVFLSSLMRTLKSKDTLTDPQKVYDISQVVADNMTLSTSMASVNTLASLAYTLKDVPLGSITFIQYPTEYGTVNGEDGVLPNVESAVVTLTAVFSDQNVTITGGTGPGETGSVDQTPAPVTPVPVDPTVVLPDDVTGQTAEQATCSRAYTG
jgi:LCP family protein required for cell wall assembly